MRLPLGSWSWRDLLPTRWISWDPEQASRAERSQAHGGASDSAPWIPWSEWEDGIGQRFLKSLDQRARAWSTLDVVPDDFLFPNGSAPLVIGLDVNCRMLRVDFRGNEVECGEDETHQFSTGLNPSTPGVVRWSSPTAQPEDFATFAADWVEKELRRPIHQHEWRGWTFRHRRWIMGDTGEPLCWSDSANDPRRHLSRPHWIRVVRPQR
jgi:hypothetical protein